MKLAYSSGGFHQWMSAALEGHGAEPHKRPSGAEGLGRSPNSAERLPAAGLGIQQIDKKCSFFSPADSAVHLSASLPAWQVTFRLQVRKVTKGPRPRSPLFEAPVTFS